MADWRLVKCSFLLLFIVTCYGAPIPENAISSVLQWPAAFSGNLTIWISVVFLFICGVVVFNCSCCTHKDISAIREGANDSLRQINSHAASHFQDQSEFVIFPPCSSVINLQPVHPLNYGSGEDKIVFEPLPDILPKNHMNGQNLAQSSKPAHFSALLKKKSSLHDWFDDPSSNFPRNQLQYFLELGHGWFGRVVEGEAQSILPDQAKTPVVVKILREEASPSEHLYFLHEVRPYRDLQHKNIVRLLGRCLETDPFLLIMEHTSLNLKSYLVQYQDNFDRDASNSNVQAHCERLLQIAADVTSGLAYMHKNSFTHTDLAAHNCFVGSDLVTKIGDYGLAFDLFREDYFCVGDLALPIRWYSPEVLKCTETTLETHEITTESNIWALGVVFWEILECGKLPYPELTNEEVLQQVIVDRAVQPKAPHLANFIKPEIYQIMQLCWKSAHVRPRIQELKSMLFHLLEHPLSTYTKTSFDQRWEALQNKEVPSIHNSPMKFENDFVPSSTGPNLPIFSSDFNLSESLPFAHGSFRSPSLKGLSGSFDELAPLDLEPANVPSENSSEDISIPDISDRHESSNEVVTSEQISEAIRDLDAMLASESLILGVDSQCPTLERPKETKVDRETVFGAAKHKKAILELAEDALISNAVDVPALHSRQFEQEIDALKSDPHTVVFERSLAAHSDVPNVLTSMKENSLLFSGDKISGKDIESVTSKGDAGCVPLPDIVITEGTVVDSPESPLEPNLDVTPTESVSVKRNMFFVYKDDNDDELEDDTEGKDESLPADEESSCEIPSPPLTSTPTKGSSSVFTFSNSGMADITIPPLTSEHSSNSFTTAMEGKSLSANESVFETAINSGGGGMGDGSSEPFSSKHTSSDSSTSPKMEHQNPAVNDSGFEAVIENSGKSASSMSVNGRVSTEAEMHQIDGETGIARFTASGEDTKNKLLNGHFSSGLKRDPHYENLAFLASEDSDPPQNSVRENGISHPPEENSKHLTQSLHPSFPYCDSNLAASGSNCMAWSPNSFTSSFAYQNSSFEDLQVINLLKEGDSTDLAETISDSFLFAQNGHPGELRMTSSTSKLPRDISQQCLSDVLWSPDVSTADPKKLMRDSATDSFPFGDSLLPSNSYVPSDFRNNNYEPTDPISASDSVTENGGNFENCRVTFSLDCSAEHWPKSSASEVEQDSESYSEPADSEEVLKIDTETNEAILVDSSESLIGFVPSRSIELLQEYKCRNPDVEDNLTDNFKDKSCSLPVSPALLMNSNNLRKQSFIPPDNRIQSEHDGQCNGSYADSLVGTPVSLKSEAFSDSVISGDDKSLSLDSEPLSNPLNRNVSMTNEESDEALQVESVLHDTINDNITSPLDFPNHDNHVDNCNPQRVNEWPIGNGFSKQGYSDTLVLESKEILAGGPPLPNGHDDGIIPDYEENDKKFTAPSPFGSSDFLDRLNVSPSPNCSAASSPCREVYTPDFETESEETSSSCSSTSGSFECIHNRFKDAADISAETETREIVLTPEPSPEHCTPLKIFSKTWDCHATPNKGLLKTPEKIAVPIKKSVSFHEDPQLVFQYPAASDSSEEEYTERDDDFTWHVDYTSFADWDLQANEEDDIPEEMVEIEELEYEPYNRSLGYRPPASRNPLSGPSLYTLTQFSEEEDLEMPEMTGASQFSAFAAGNFTSSVEELSSTKAAEDTSDSVHLVSFTNGPKREEIMIEDLATMPIISEQALPVNDSPFVLVSAAVSDSSDINAESSYNQAASVPVRVTVSRDEHSLAQSLQNGAAETCIDILRENSTGIWEEDGIPQCIGSETKNDNGIICTAGQQQVGELNNPMDKRDLPGLGNGLEIGIDNVDKLVNEKDASIATLSFRSEDLEACPKFYFSTESDFVFQTDAVVPETERAFAINEVLSKDNVACEDGMEELVGISNLEISGLRDADNEDSSDLPQVVSQIVQDIIDSTVRDLDVLSTNRTEGPSNETVPDFHDVSEDHIAASEDSSEHPLVLPALHEDQKPDIEDVSQQNSALKADSSENELQVALRNNLSIPTIVITDVDEPSLMEEEMRFLDDLNFYTLVDDDAEDFVVSSDFSNVPFGHAFHQDSELMRDTDAGGELYHSGRLRKTTSEDQLQFFDDGADSGDEVSVLCRSSSLPNLPD